MSFELQTDSHLSSLTPNQVRALKFACEAAHLNFTRFFFKVRTAAKFIVDEHHRIICDILDQVIHGRYKRLIINVPPGFTKTELAVIHFIARGLAINPRSRFVHTSYSDSLVATNSSQTKDVIQSAEYQTMWPMFLRDDARGQHKWYNTLGGGMLASPAGGSITGFRAGQIMSGFSGAFIVDDPLKPDDASSSVKVERINARHNNTYRSRLIHEDVPFIVIMQRLSESDYCDFLLKGGSDEKWHHLMLPGRIKPESEREYPEEYTHGIPIPYDLNPGPLWPQVLNDKQLRAWQQSNAYDYATQVDQHPIPLGGAVFKRSWFAYWVDVDYVQNMITTEEGKKVEIVYKMIVADTAMRAGQHNDYTVFQCWALGDDDRIYLLDQFRDKIAAWQLEEEFEAFNNRHEFRQGINHTGIRARYIEDKSSGIGLIDTLNHHFGVGFVEGLQRDRDKIGRAKRVLHLYRRGCVVLPKFAPYTGAFISEHERFTETDTHKHDDQIDPTVDALQLMLVDSGIGDYAALL
jgi:predicted phage terminase large subunit-like protein